MGCNLCTLQKREEHYKLLYEIAQVNGRELSKAGHEEALDVFRSAKDPIVVQVLRRSPIHKARGPHEVPLVDVCTQTDITFEHIMALAKLRPTTPPVPDTCPFLLSDSCHSLHTMEREYYDSPEYLPNLQADGERPDSFEYEEVELCRMNSQEKLGLTLCYRTDDDEDVAIYVSEVGPNSIAARDGRIREGDRILQINGQDVQDREEAVALLSSEDSWSILLLVARPETQLEEGWLDEEHNEFLEELKLEMLKEKQREEIQQAVESMKQFRKPKDDDITTDTATCSSNNQDKDSGVGRTDDSMRHGESSEQEVLAQLKHKFSRCLPDGVERGHAHCESLPLERFPEEEEERQEEDEEEGGQDHFQQLLELKCQISNGGEYGLYYSRRSTIECSLTEPAGVERELRLLNEELRSIELECQTIMQAHQLRKAREAHLGEQPERSDKDSSSAYNTAESCRSTPERPLPRRVSLANQKNLRSTLVANRLGFKPPRSVAGSYCHGDESQAVSSSCSDMGNSSMLPAGSNSCHGDKARKLVNVIESLPGNGNESRLISNVNCRPNSTDHQGAEQSQEGSRLPYLPPYDAISTHTHQYQSYMHLVQQRSAVEFGLTGVEPKMEWKVKIRSDGTRYITKRPARDRILRERALKIREERCGTTTDDDAMSELKTGRYWSKEERKQQLARAREQRRRREFMQRSRLESLREAPQSGGEGRREVSIIELSHRKMMKKRNKKILDNWMTIQELMTHGAKAAEGAKVHNAFLSVTTV